MLAVLSPAKSLDFESTLPTKRATQPLFREQAAQLVEILRDYSPEDLSRLMDISQRLGELNYQRYQQWQLPFSLDNARQAIFAFTGDVYTGLDVHEFGQDDLAFAQDHLRVLSGLYGILRPLDLIQAYRLEMGTSLSNPAGRNLYDFWSDTVTRQLNRELAKQDSPLLVNLASNEYARVIDEKALDGEIITPVFKDYKNGQYKIISFYAKKARGMMAAHIVRERATNRDDLTRFKAGGYRYSSEESTADKPVFLRKQAE